jgi:hypothetical protein
MMHDLGVHFSQPLGQSGTLNEGIFQSKAACYCKMLILQPRTRHLSIRKSRHPVGEGAGRTRKSKVGRQFRPTQFHVLQPCSEINAHVEFCLQNSHSLFAD